MSRSTQCMSVISSHTGLSPSRVRLSIRFCSIPDIQSAGPRSLATTNGVSVDFLSSSYLDVSVRSVRLFTLCIHVKIPPTRWVAPFGYPRINDCSPLPAAFRKVLRPSSPLSAKASTKCSCLLVHSIRIYYSHKHTHIKYHIPSRPFYSAR